MSSINYSNYSITATLIPDLTVPTVETVDLKNCKTFDKDRLLGFNIVKNIFDTNCVPLYELILFSPNEDELHYLSNILVMLEISITINNTEVYKNTYKIKSSSESRTELKPKNNINFKKIHLVLESYFIHNLINSNTFYNLSSAGEYVTNISIYNKLTDFLVKHYGTSLEILTNISKLSRTSNNFFDFSYNAESTDLDNLVNYIHNDRISTYPILFGVDEVFHSISSGDNISVTPGTITELITLDLYDSDSIHFVSDSVVSFLNSTSYSMSSAKFIEPYFSSIFIKNTLCDKFEYEDTASGNVFVLEPITNTSIKMDKINNNLPSNMYLHNELIPKKTFRGNLNRIEVNAWRQNCYDFFKKSPKIYRVDFTKATLDLFKLGRKTNLGNLEGVSIIVAAEINITYGSNPNIRAGELIDSYNHICSGSVYLLNWVP
jgi:hypothetical protein